MVIALAVATGAALPWSASADVSIGISVGVAPPPLPVYEQPVIPAPGYIWVPGYWAWDPDIGDYYWVPGTWVSPPYSGALWTPGYWGWAGSAFVFHVGYWGPHVGFYGGINYGFGYTGEGYEGGYWRGGSFYYNRSVNRIENVNITNVYNRTVVNNITVNRTSFNGGQGGIAARPTPQQESFAREQHVGPVAAQEQQRSMASQNREMRASFNHGAPSIGATPRAGAFSGQGVTPTHGAAGQPTPAAMGAQRTNPPVQQPRDNMALHSSGFAPHSNGPANAPNAGHANNPAPMENRAMREPGNPGGGYHENAAPRPSYPQHEARPEPAYQGHAQPAPRPEAEPRPQPQPRPQPHPQPQPHAQPHEQAPPHHGDEEHH